MLSDGELERKKPSLLLRAALEVSQTRPQGKEEIIFLTKAKDAIVETSSEIPNHLVLVSLHLFLTFNNRRSAQLQLGRLLKRKLSYLTVTHEQPANLLFASPSLSRCNIANHTTRSEFVFADSVFLHYRVQRWSKSHHLMHNMEALALFNQENYWTQYAIKRDLKNNHESVLGHYDFKPEASRVWKTESRC